MPTTNAPQTRAIRTISMPDATDATTEQSQDLQYIRVGDLKVDPELQRELKESRVIKIMRHFDERLLQAIVVSRRDNGDLFICEGQHRAVGTQRLFGDDYLIPAVIHIGLSRKDEANLFRGINNGRAKIGAYDDYRIGIEAGDPLCVEIEVALKANGLQMRGSSSANCVAAATACKRIVEKSSGYLLEEVLAVAIDAWGRHSESYDADIIQAIAELYIRNKGTVQTSRVVSTLASLPVVQWKQRGMAYSASHGGSTSRSLNIAKAFTDAYNKRLHADNRIEI